MFRRDLARAILEPPRRIGEDAAELVSGQKIAQFLCCRGAHVQHIASRTSFVQHEHYRNESKLPTNVHPPLYAASVPVFLHYIDRLEALSARGAAAGLNGARLAPDMFGFGQQVATALRLSLRVSHPLAGVPVPPDPALGTEGAALAERFALTRAALDALDPMSFADAGSRTIRHAAGFAELEQDGATFLHLFGMPNFLFHAGMAFAILRANGVVIGKADFDGQHDYPVGFRF